MRLDRRRFALLAAAAATTAAAAAPAWAYPAGAPVIVAEGGAAEERIQDTRSAFDLAMDQGCDFIQVNLTPTREGALAACRSGALAASTDVAERPEFASRKTAPGDGGVSVADWFTNDFTLEELKTLLRREPEPGLRPQNVRWDGKEPILALPEVLAIARDGCVRLGRTIGVCARLVRPSYYQGLGLDVVQRLAGELASEGYIAPAAAVWVQSSEHEALRAFARLSPVRRMLLIEEGAPAPDQGALAAARAVAQAIGPDQSLLIDLGAAQFPTPTPLAADAHAAGLVVFSRTARPENAFLPPALRRGEAPGDHGDVVKLLAALFALPLDGVSTVVPAAAARARRSLRQA